MTKELFIDALNKNSEKIYMAYNKLQLFKELCNLCANRKPYENVLNKHSYFWACTIDSLKHSLISEVAHVFDEHDDSIGLRKLTNVYQQNPLWTQSWCSEHEEKHSNLVKSINDIYESSHDDRIKLKTFRDKFSAHYDRRVLSGKVDVSDFTWGCFEDLISIAAEIIERLSVTTQGIGIEYVDHASYDTRKLIKCIQRGMETKPKDAL
ncbi:MAG: hypothetical protein E7598_07600 [Ruminococcaceae bacterium]|nr:hypothetical protein [Oscillospiraceae bacterium]